MFDLKKSRELLSMIFENSIPFSFINYAAHCSAWLSYGKKIVAEAMSGWVRKRWKCITSPMGRRVGRKFPPANRLA